MIIKLTNLAKEHKGKALLLNPRYIISVYPALDEDKNEITIVYGALKESWSVQESTEEIYALIKQCK